MCSTSGVMVWSGSVCELTRGVGDQVRLPLLAEQAWSGLAGLSVVGWLTWCVDRRILVGISVASLTADV